MDFNIAHMHIGLSLFWNFLKHISCVLCVFTINFSESVKLEYLWYATCRYYESNVEFELGFTNWLSFTSKSHNNYNYYVSHNTHTYIL